MKNIQIVKTPFYSPYATSKQLLIFQSGSTQLCVQKLNEQQQDTSFTIEIYPQPLRQIAIIQPCFFGVAQLKTFTVSTGKIPRLRRQAIDPNDSFVGCTALPPACPHPTFLFLTRRSFLYTATLNFHRSKEEKIKTPPPLLTVCTLRDYGYPCGMCASLESVLLGYEQGLLALFPLNQQGVGFTLQTKSLMPLTTLTRLSDSFAVGTCEGTILIVNNGLQLIQQLSVHYSAVNTLVCSSENTLCSVGDDCVLRLYETTPQLKCFSSHHFDRRLHFAFFFQQEVVYSLYEDTFLYSLK